MVNGFSSAAIQTAVRTQRKYVQNIEERNHQNFAYPQAVLEALVDQFHVFTVWQTPSMQNLAPGDDITSLVLRTHTKYNVSLLPLTVLGRCQAFLVCCSSCFVFSLLILYLSIHFCCIFLFFFWRNALERLPKPHFLRQFKSRWQLAGTHGAELLRSM